MDLPHGSSGPFYLSPRGGGHKSGSGSLDPDPLGAGARLSAALHDGPRQQQDYHTGS